MTRHFREDFERIVKVRGMWVRRPQAYRVEPETWGSVARHNWPEILFGSLTVIVLFAALAYGPWLLGGGAR